MADQYRTTITFVTAEPVTRDHLTRRLLDAAGQFGALRPGEGALSEDGTFLELEIRQQTDEERQAIADLIGGVTTTPKIELTEARKRALRLVDEGQLEYSKATGDWEPLVGPRLPAFTWLSENGLIEPDYEAEPEGRVMQRVPVYLTDEGNRVLETM